MVKRQTEFVTDSLGPALAVLRRAKFREALALSCVTSCRTGAEERLQGFCKIPTRGEGYPHPKLCSGSTGPLPHHRCRWRAAYSQYLETRDRRRCRSTRFGSPGPNCPSTFKLTIAKFYWESVLEHRLLADLALLHSTPGQGRKR